MRIYFYFVLFFMAKCLNFCCEECCGDCCCDWWYNLWEDCYKKSNKEEDCLNDYRKGQERMYLQNIEEIRKQKEELKNKIRQYLSHIKNDVENINLNFGRDNSVKKDLLNQITRINELIENFKEDEYFERNSIEKIQGDLGDLQDLCRKAGIISLDVFYKENEKWKKFLNENNIQEKYVEEKNITQEKFSLGNTLVKLENNFGTYLLEIFKTRLYPTNKNGDKYKNEFMKFYSDYQIDVFKNTLIIEDFFPDFCRQILQKVKLDYNDDENKNIALNIYKNALCEENYLYLGYALLTDGDESSISDEINGKIKCNIFTDANRLKEEIISPLINSFKHNIVEIIKDSLQEQLNVNKNLQKNKSEEIKKIASNNYNEAIKNLNVEKIKLTFYNSYNKEMKIKSFFKDCKLSVLFDYVLSKGRKFYASNEERKIVEDKLGYVSYEDEKGKLELKTALTWGGESLNNAINEKQDITIGEFYEKRFPNVYMFFKKD